MSELMRLAIASYIVNEPEFPEGIRLQAAKWGSVNPTGRPTRKELLKDRWAINPASGEG